MKVLGAAGWTPMTEEDTAYGLRASRTQLAVPDAYEPKRCPESLRCVASSTTWAATSRSFVSELEATRVR
jgi:hypothetical protein